MKVDESSIKDIPGAKVVWDKGFLGVVADREWDAIKASRALKVEWSTPGPAFPDQPALYDHIRKAPTRKRECGKHAGDVDAAFKTAAKVIEAEYEWPFQSHARMGPGCALVDIKDGKGMHVTCWSGTQKSHFVQMGVAAILQVPKEQVRVIWTTGPGSYGRSDADDCAADAAVLAKAVGKPVRVQYMRDQGTGWDPKAPASIHTARAALDAAGNVIAYDYLSKGFSRVDVDTNGGQPRDTLAGQDMGVALKSGDGFGFPGDFDGFANKRAAWETIAPLLDRASPLRTAHMRDPVGPQIHFASESFIDEVAAALKVDPVEFRLRYVRDPRDIAVIKAVAEKFGLAIAAVAAQRPARRQGLGPRHRLCAARTDACRRGRRGRGRSLERKDLGAQVHRRPRLRPDRQPGWAASRHREQHRAGHEPYAVGKRSGSTRRASPASTGGPTRFST